MKRKPFTIRLTVPQIARISIFSFLLTVFVLVLLTRIGHRWRGAGPVPAWAWVVGMIIPALDLLLGLRVLQASRRLSVARPLLFAGVVLALFVAWTLWTWR